MFEPGPGKFKDYETALSKQ